MKWFKLIIISSLIVFQFSGCSMDSSDEGLSVARMKDGSRGLPVPAGDIANLDVTNMNSGDWGGIYSNAGQVVFEQNLRVMMQTSADPIALGNVSPILGGGGTGTGVFFKGRLTPTQSNLSLQNAQQYLQSLKDDPSKIQMYITIFDHLVGAWNNGVVFEPYSFYYGASSSGFRGNIAFNYEIDVATKSIRYAIFLMDHYGETTLFGTLVSGAENLDGEIRYLPRWNNSSAYTTIGQFKIKACSLFKCS